MVALLHCVIRLKGFRNLDFSLSRNKQKQTTKIQLNRNKQKLLDVKKLVNKLLKVPETSFIPLIPEREG